MLTDFLRPYLSKKLYAKIYQIGLNLWPCIRGGAGRVVHISEDFMNLRVRLSLSWRSRNLVGTIYGGSMYASTDPMFMLMLMEILGNQYVVWDKGCTIRFKRPGKVTMFCDFQITDAMLAEIHKNLDEKSEHSFTWQVQYKDTQENVYAEFDKVLYVAKKSFYKEKLKSRSLENKSLISNT